MSRYRKAVVALLAGLGTWGLATYPDAPWWGLLGVIATALGVYQVPNEDTSVVESP